MLFLNVSSCPEGAVNLDDLQVNTEDRLELAFYLHNSYTGHHTTNVEDLDSPEHTFFVSLWTATPSRALCQLVLQYMANPYKTLHVYTPLKEYPVRRHTFTDESKLISLVGRELQDRGKYESFRFVNKYSRALKKKPIIYNGEFSA